MNLSLETVLRCLDILPLIRENQGLELSELAERSGLTEKVIVDQIIPSLMLCGSPPYLPHDYVSIWMEGDRVFCEFADQFARPVTLLPIEITALHAVLSSAFLDEDHEIETKARLDDIRRRIEEALPKAQRIFLEESHRISVEDNPERDSRTLTRIKTAIAECRKAVIQYLSFGDAQTKRRVIHPYGVVVQNGVTYVPSFDETRGIVISFKLDRFVAVELTDETFETSKEFSLEQYARDGLFRRRDDETEAVIRVKGPTARWRSEELDQSSWRWVDEDTLEVRLATGRPMGLVKHVLGWGPDAEIISPPEIRALALEEIQRLREAHAG